MFQPWRPGLSVPSPTARYFSRWPTNPLVTTSGDIAVRGVDIPLVTSTRHVAVCGIYIALVATTRDVAISCVD